MRTENKNGILTDYVKVGEEERNLVDVYSELRDLIKKHVCTKKDRIKADQLLMAIYFPLFLNTNSKENPFENRIKFLEDNAFADRAKRIELENKLEDLTNKIIRLEHE